MKRNYYKELLLYKQLLARNDYTIQRISVGNTHTSHARSPSTHTHSTYQRQAGEDNLPLGYRAHMVDHVGDGMD